MLHAPSVYSAPTMARTLSFGRRKRNAWRAALARLAPGAALATIAALAGVSVGCEGAGSDMRDFAGTFAGPTPQDAAVDATNPSDAEAQRRGTVLLSSAVWGGSPVYVKLYRLYVEENVDPLVRAAALEALGRHGEPSDAVAIAKQLDHASRQVRLAAAKALQRLHDPEVADAMWRKLIDGDEEADVRVELAIGLAQYPTDAVFQALCTALDQRELAVNLAAADSLRLLTNQDMGLDRALWLSWYRAQKEPFDQRIVYLFPTYQRRFDFWDVVVFWQPITWDRPSIPAGMTDPGLRPTNDPDEFEDVGDGKS